MVDSISHLISEYSAWLRSEFTLRQYGDWVEVTTPFLDRNNDCLQIYVLRDHTGFTLTDDGHILAELAMSGCEIETPRRRALLHETLNGFAVELSEGALVVHADEANFAQRKHSLMQAMMAVDDMYYVAQPVVRSLFIEEVSRWMDLSDIRNAASVSRLGKSGISHRFNFLVPKSRQQPERYINAVNDATSGAAKNFIFSWIDTQETRAADSRGYLLANDEDKPVPAAVRSALESYDLRLVPWSQRGSVRDVLAA